MVNVLITSCGSTPAMILARNIIKDERLNNLVLVDVKSLERVALPHVLNNDLKTAGENGRNKNDINVYFHQVSMSKGREREFVGEILELLEKYDVNFVVPILPDDILTLYGVISEIMATECSVSFCDKSKTVELFEKNGIPQPRHIEFPLIVKPYVGMAGAENKVLKYNCNKHNDELYQPKYVIQEFFTNMEEFTVDVILDKNGKILGKCTRKRIATKTGLCTEAETIDDVEINRLVERICGLFKFYGQINIQFIRDLNTGSLYVLEINPRPGGSSAISYKAGMNISQMIIDAYLGVKKNYPVPKIGVKMLRYWNEVYLYW